MKLADFDFNLPENLIAQFPLSERCASRLLCLNKNTGKLEHKIFKDLPNLLQPNDLLIFNDTKVIPARLLATKPTGGKTEILVERILDNHKMLAQIRASKTPKVGSYLHLTTSIKFLITNRAQEFFELTLESTETLLEVLEKFGHTPLPPYIERDANTNDHERYQTIFAKHHGAVAAPTAGLHFDNFLMNELKLKKIQTAFITLHVGAGTFKPVRVDDITQHQMHAEYYVIPQATYEAISQTKKNSGRIIAVGTTTVRALETAAPFEGQNNLYSSQTSFQGLAQIDSSSLDFPLGAHEASKRSLQQVNEHCERVCNNAENQNAKSIQGNTNIFIYPGYKFRCVDAMITNFHLPKSTLLMLVCAFAGYEHTMHAYQEAIKHNYRFYSYGDAMFIF